jgi:hypothetical protein
MAEWRKQTSIDYNTYKIIKHETARKNMFVKDFLHELVIEYAKKENLDIEKIVEGQ